MERTTQELRIEEAIDSILANFGNICYVYVASKEDAIREKLSTKAETNRGKIRLTLVEANNKAELDEWANAIVKAEELINVFEKEQYWKFTNPRFSEAIKARVEYHYRIKNGNC